MCTRNKIIKFIPVASALFHYHFRSLQTKRKPLLRGLLGWDLVFRLNQVFQVIKHFSEFEELVLSCEPRLGEAGSAFFGLSVDVDKGNDGGDDELRLLLCNGSDTFNASCDYEVDTNQKPVGSCLAFYHGAQQFRALLDEFFVTRHYCPSFCGLGSRYTPGKSRERQKALPEV